MKVQSKFILMSMAAMFAMISSASAVNVPGLRETNRIRSALDRKIRKLDRAQEKLLDARSSNARGDAYADRKDRKEAKTYEQVNALCEKLDSSIEANGLSRYAQSKCGSTQSNDSESSRHDSREFESQSSESISMSAPAVRTRIVTIDGVDYVLEIDSNEEIMAQGNGTGAQGTNVKGSGAQGADVKGSGGQGADANSGGTAGQGDQGNNPGNDPGEAPVVGAVTPTKPTRPTQPPVTPEPQKPVVRKTVVKKKKVITTANTTAKKTAAPMKRVTPKPAKLEARAQIESIKLESRGTVTAAPVFEPTLPSMSAVRVSAFAEEKMVNLKAVAKKKTKNSSRIVVDAEDKADDMKSKSDDKSKDRKKFKGTVPESIKDIIIAKQQSKDGLSQKDISNLTVKNYDGIRADTLHLNLKKEVSANSAN